MNKYLLAVCLSVICFVNILNAQITITNQDLPSAGDTFRVSNGLITPAIDPIPSGAAFTWDFSMLEWVTQDIDTFVSVASTGITYSFIFADVPFNNNRANHATEGQLNLPAIPIGGLTITDVVSFYYNSSADYHQSGYGASINGIGVPIAFDNKDIIFELPMNYGDSHSSFSDFQLSIPNLGYYGHDQVRDSEVDGWGTLITPYGTFNTLRVRAVITPHDTIFADTLGFGFGFMLPPTVEYKWMGLQGGIPLLQINSTLNPGGGETVISIVYRDSLRIATGIGENINTAAALSLNLYPNPSNGQFTMEYVAAENETADIKMYSVEGRNVMQIFKGEISRGTGEINISTEGLSLAAGYYFIEAKVGQNTIRKPLVIGTR